MPCGFSPSSVITFLKTSCLSASIKTKEGGKWLIEVALPQWLHGGRGAPTVEGPKGLEVSETLQMRLKTSSAISKPKLGFQSGSLGCYIIVKTWSTDTSGPTSPEHSKVLYKGIHIGLAEPSLRRHVSRFSSKSSPPHLQLGPSGHSNARATSVLVRNSENCSF